MYINKFYRRFFISENLKNAIVKTFNKRDTDIKSINKVIDEIEKSEFVKELWTSYSEKYQYAKCLEFKNVINSIKRIEKIFL